MKMYFDSEKDYTDFKAEIAKRLRDRERLKVSHGEAVPSAVLMLLMNKDNEPYVLLTQRTQNVRTHKGQVSFPGGARENGDKSILDTALRETYEETGIDPSKIEIIGKFDEMISVSNFHVTPVIGSISYPYEYKANKNEIETCFEAPLSIFYNREYYKTENFTFNGESRTVFYYLYNGFEIWGMTAGLLTKFTSVILKNEPSWK